MRLSKCERNKHLLRWSLEKSLLELLPLLLRRFLMFAEACQSFQHPGLQERAALMFLIGCTRKTTGLAFSLRLRFGFCYRLLCHLLRQGCADFLCFRQLFLLTFTCYCSWFIEVVHAWSVKSPSVRSLVPVCAWQRRSLGNVIILVVTVTGKGPYPNYTRGLSYQ